MWGQLSSEWGELSSEGGASCLGASFLWGEMSWGELSYGRVVRNPTVVPTYLPTSGATGAVVKPRTLGREVPGSSPPVAVCCGLEQVTYPQLLRK